MRRVAYITFVDLDPTPGTMNTVQSAHEVVRNIIHQRLENYHPEITIPGGRYQTFSNHRRPAFLIVVDLDEMPGVMNDEISAGNIIYATLMQRMSHYVPTICRAPEDLQPINIEEGSTTA
jgi:hypothetical protein